MTSRQLRIVSAVCAWHKLIKFKLVFSALCSNLSARATKKVKKDEIAIKALFVRTSVVKILNKTNETLSAVLLSLLLMLVGTSGVEGILKLFSLDFHS